MVIYNRTTARPRFIHTVTMPGAATDLQELSLGSAIELSIASEKNEPKSTEKNVSVNGGAANGHCSGVNKQQHSAAIDKSREEGSELWFQSCPNRRRHEEFLFRVVDILLECGVFASTSRSSKVLEWKDPEELKNILDLQLQEEPVSHETLLEYIHDTIKYSVKTGHPHFINQLFSRSVYNSDSF